MMLEYMKEKGFTTPKAAWLTNIRTFLNVPLRPDVEQWSAEVKANACPADAIWFRKHLLGTFLSFRTPKISLMNLC